MSTQVILLQRVEKLGNMGDLVNVKPGFARNYLLPQKKALRASKENIAYFEAQKKHLEAENTKQMTEAQKLAKKVEGLKVPVIRQASAAGQLFGSVTSRDIAADVAALSGVEVTRAMVEVNQNFKTLGLFDVTIALHPEVLVQVTVNIARSAEEAEIQAETGKALITDDASQTVEEIVEEAAAEVDDENLEAALEEGALEAEKEKAVKDAEEAAAAAVKAEEKAAKKAEKAAAAAEEAEESAEVEASEEAAEEPAKDEKTEE